MTRWEQGRSTVEDLLNRGELSRVPPNPDDAQHLLDRTTRRLESARALAEKDPDAAYTLGYDAARQALTALLWTQGLRPSTHGGHKVVHDALRAQLDPPLGRDLAQFDRMRRERHALEYPTPGQGIASHDTTGDLDKVAALIEMARQLLPGLPVF